MQPIETSKYILPNKIKVSKTGKYDANPRRSIPIYGDVRRGKVLTKGYWSFSSSMAGW